MSVQYSFRVAIDGPAAGGQHPHHISNESLEVKTPDSFSTIALAASDFAKQFTGIGVHALSGNQLPEGGVQTWRPLADRVWLLLVWRHENLPNLMDVCTAKNRLMTFASIGIGRFKLPCNGRESGRFGNFCIR